MSTAKIVVVGSVNTDMVIKSERIPSPGETVTGGEFVMLGAYVAMFFLVLLGLLPKGMENALERMAFSLLGLVLFFFWSIEGRMKRRRALRAIHELRSMAHIIDMHQLTKDPTWLRHPPTATALEGRNLSVAELTRYLDYSTDMLSLTGKIAALYVQDFQDSVALSAVNEIELLTTSLSGKIWQKLSILDAEEARRNG